MTLSWHPARWLLVSAHRGALLLTLSLLGVLLVGCNTDPKKLGPGNVDDPNAATANSCAIPQTGCACKNPGQVIECGVVNERLVDYATCALGTRECLDEQWSECRTTEITGPRKTTDQRYLALGMPDDVCADNPCDPFCHSYIDDPTGLGDGNGGFGGNGGLIGGTPGLVGVGDGGVSLEPGGGPVTIVGTCTGLAVVPANQSFVVTSLSPFKVEPASAQFTAELTPSGCAMGTVTASWTLSNPDTAVINDQGVFTVYSPVAQVQTVRAFAGNETAIGTATVTVDIQSNSGAPPGSVGQFASPTIGNDTADFIYPYANTLFPRGIRAPKLQWNKGALGAGSAVKISLRYPAVGAAEFSWSQIVPEGANGQATIPQDIWAGLDQTASGAVALISMQRVVGGSRREAVERPIKFSTAPLRGRIFYTEYQRGPDTRAGPSCWFNNNGTVIRSLDPGTTNAPTNPFGNTNCTNVCHSVSADGSTFVSAGRIATINASGAFTPIATPPQPLYPGQDQRGFAWSGITPDGTYVLQGNNIWGNTIMGDEEHTGASRLSGGNGNGLFADYYNNPTLSGNPVFSRIDQTIDFTWLEGSPHPSVNDDGFSVRWSGELQALETELYTFETQTNDGVKLSVGGTVLLDHMQDGAATWTATKALVQGQKYYIEMDYYDNTGEAQAVLRWSSPNTAYGPIPMNQLFARP